MNRDVYVVVIDQQPTDGAFPSVAAAINSPDFTNATGRRITVEGVPSGRVRAVRIARNIVGFMNAHRMSEDRDDEDAI